jgi:hypothetical protein
LSGKNCSARLTNDDNKSGVCIIINPSPFIRY